LPDQADASQAGAGQPSAGQASHGRADTGLAGLDRAANLVGALSLVIADQAADAVAEAAGRSDSAGAAL
jgi:hypothetical protein